MGPPIVLLAKIDAQKRRRAHVVWPPFRAFFAGDAIHCIRPSRTFITPVAVPGELDFEISPDWRHRQPQTEIHREKQISPTLAFVSLCQVLLVVPSQFFHSREKSIQPFKQFRKPLNIENTIEFYLRRVYSDPRARIEKIYYDPFQIRTAQMLVAAGLSL